MSFRKLRILPTDNVWTEPSLSSRLGSTRNSPGLKHQNKRWRLSQNAWFFFRKSKEQEACGHKKTEGETSTAESNFQSQSFRFGCRRCRLRKQIFIIWILKQLTFGFWTTFGQLLQRSMLLLPLYGDSTWGIYSRPPNRRQPLFSQLPRSGNVIEAPGGGGTRLWFGRRQLLG